MKLHANARTCPNSRKLLVSRIEEELVADGGGRGRRHQRANARASGSAAGGRRRGRPARSLLRRRGGPPPHLPSRRSRRSARLRRLRMTAAEIAEVFGMALSTVSLWLTRIGLGKRSRLSHPSRPTATSASGPASSSTSTSRSSAASAGRRQARRPATRHRAAAGASAASSVTSASTTPPGSPTSRCSPTSAATTAIGFLRRAVRLVRRDGVTVERVMTDNGSRYRLDGPRRPPVASSASATSAPGPTGPRPTARPSASSRRCSGEWAYGRVCGAQPEPTEALPQLALYLATHRQLGSLGLSPAACPLASLASVDPFRIQLEG